MNHAAILACLLVACCQPAQATPPTPPPPAKAHQYLPTLKRQIQELMPGFPAPAYFGGLIEHESCISLTHSRCWSPTSRLRTDREEGAGLGQITRTFNPDGSLRFDAIADARRIDPHGLNDLRWETVYQRPDLQMRVIVLMTRATYHKLSKVTPDPLHRLAMTDAAYNGGLQGVLNERRACASRPACDPDLWFGHVENTCLKSKRPLYGTRSACDINRHHVRDVLLNRMPKYIPYL
jgi:hypothetical protein